MIESKLKVKNANSGQLFRHDWVSSAECMPHRIEQPAQRQLSIKSCRQLLRTLAAFSSAVPCFLLSHIEKALGRGWFMGYAFHGSTFLQTGVCSDKV